VRLAGHGNFIPGETRWSEDLNGNYRAVSGPRIPIGTLKALKISDIVHLLAYIFLSMLLSVPMGMRGPDTAR